MIIQIQNIYHYPQPSIMHRLLMISHKFLKMATSSESLTSKQSDNNPDTQKLMEKCYENYILVDIGANLTHKKFLKDLDSVIRRAKESG